MVRYRGSIAAAMMTAVIALLSASCGGDSVSGTARAERYRYASEQRTPVVAFATGVFTVTQRIGERFDGTLDVLQTDPNGRVERRAGIVRGRLSAGTMDFDVMLDGDVYRHVGRALSDTVSGNWLDVSAVGNVATGTFRLERSP